jgi:FkbM family methyltransferase
MADWTKAVLAVKRLVYGARGEPFVVGGHTLRYVPGTRPTRPAYAASQEDGVARYDALEGIVLAERLKEGDIAIDIGANVGQHTLVMAALCGASGTVVAFEPNPEARKVLERNIALNPGFKPPLVEALAASDEAGELTFFIEGAHPRSSLAEAALNSNARAITVRTVALDDYGLAPQWVKIDTEGAEIAILRGARRLLATDAEFLVELHPYAWPEFGVTLEDLEALLAESGRWMRYLDEEGPVRDVRYGVVLLERGPQP